jgi:hypothetical protein
MRTTSSHSGNVQGTFREFREHFGKLSGNILGKFREHSVNIQGTFREHSAYFKSFRENSGNIQ